MSLRCAVCPGDKRVVRGCGPVPSRYLAIGEAPGKDEDRIGVPFVGKTGQEWDHTYLERAGLKREEVYVTNTVLCRPNQNKKPSSKEAIGCADWHLREEIEAVQPEVIFLLGATACSLVPSVTLEVEHGIPQWCEDLYGWQGWVVPMDHPAKGLHDSSNMIEMLEDWEGLKGWLAYADGCAWQWPVDQFPKTYYSLVTTPDDIDQYIYTFITDPTVYNGPLWAGVDTELADTDGKPYSIQVSIAPGTGIMVYLDDKDSCALLAQRLRDFIPIFHNQEADYDIVKPFMGRPTFIYRDTMQEAYQQGNLPQALKTLGYRLFGVRMQSWEDLVLPWSKRALTEWMLGQLETEVRRPLLTRDSKQTRCSCFRKRKSDPECIFCGGTGKVYKLVEKTNENEKLLRRVLRYTEQNAEYDPWERLDGKLSGYPLKGIKHVPEEEAVQYAVRDADMTLRLALWLDRKREEQGNFGVTDEDKDL